MSQDKSGASGLAAAAAGEVTIVRALLSVSDKTGIVEFARGLEDLGIEVVSTGGTARELAQAGVAVRSISDLTGFPEIMDGRVKTLHPKLYASLLAVRSNPEHVAAARDHDVEPVDLVCVNLYPFERTAATRGVSDAEVIENIDIGGPTMIRAAAKNHHFTAPVVRPESYDAVLAELRESGRRLSLATRESLAAEAFALTARYDTSIARWFQEKREDFPPLMVTAFEKAAELPHGENPHQRAAFYTRVGARASLMSMVAQRGGGALSYDNLLDLDLGRTLLAEFQIPACVIVTRDNPCGVAVGPTAADAHQRAVASDPASAAGAFVCLNRSVDRPLAVALEHQAPGVVLAPGYDDDALAMLSAREELRILDDGEQPLPDMIEPAMRQVLGGMLVQDRDFDLEERAEMQVVSARRPTEEEWSELLFAWKVCKHVRSSAIVLARELVTAGIGAGQMSRDDAVRLALTKAGAPQAGTVMASDDVFPSADGIQLALAAGIRAFIQPAGSPRDPDVVAAADTADATLVFTSRRHLRH